MNFFRPNSNKSYMKNKFLQNYLKKNENNVLNTSLETDSSYRKQNFQRSNSTNRFLRNNNLILSKRKFEIKRSINQNRNSSFLNTFNKTEINNQILYNNSKISLRDTIIKKHNSCSIFKRPIRVESSDSVITRNNDNLKFSHKISNTHCNFSETKNPFYNNFSDVT